jgi:hypothetical protein
LTRPSRVRERLCPGPLFGGRIGFGRLSLREREFFRGAKGDYSWQIPGQFERRSGKVCLLPSRHIDRGFGQFREFAIGGPDFFEHLLQKLLGV